MNSPLESLEAFFAPATVAVIGASDRPESVGRTLFLNLLDKADSRKIFAVNDVITFDEHSSGASESRGIPHFGFRLVSPGDIDAAVEEVERAGGKLLRRGEFCPGCP